MARYGLKHFFTEPFPEFHHPFLMTRWTEMSALAREDKKVFMPTALAFHTGEAIMKDAAIQVAIDNLPYAALTILFPPTWQKISRSQAERPQRVD
jgi:hypothetical protein